MAAGGEGDVAAGGLDARVEPHVLVAGQSGGLRLEEDGAGARGAHAHAVGGRVAIGHGEAAVEGLHAEAAGAGGDQIAEGRGGLPEARGRGAVRVHAVHGHRRHAANDQVVVFQKVEAAGAGARRHGVERGVERVGFRADADGRRQHGGGRGEVAAGIAVVQDGAVRGGDADGPRAQAAEGHLVESEVTDRAAARLGEGAVGHRDGALGGDNIDGASVRGEVAHHRLHEVAVGQESEVAGAGLDVGVDHDILVMGSGGAGFEAEIAGGVGDHGLVDGERAVQGHQHDGAAAGGRAHLGQRGVGLEQRRRGRAVHVHAADAQGAEGVEGQGVLVEHEDAARGRARRQRAHRRVQRIGRADAHARDEPRPGGAQIPVRVSAIEDRSGHGRHAQAAGARVQSAQGHVHRRQVTDGRAGGPGDRAVVHGDGAVGRLDVDRPVGEQVARRPLLHPAMGQHGEAAGAGAHGGVEHHVRIRGARGPGFQPDVAEGVGADADPVGRGGAIMDRQGTVAGAEHNAAAARRGEHVALRRVAARGRAGVRFHAVDGQRGHCVHRQRVFVRHKNSTGLGAGRQHRDRGFQRVGPGSDPDAGHQAQPGRAHFHRGVPAVGDRSGGGGHAHEAGAGIQPAQHHAARGQVTDVAPGRDRHGSVGHRDGTGLGLHIDRAGTARRKIPGGGLRHVAPGQHGEAARSGGNGGVQHHVPVVPGRGRRGQANVPGPLHGHGPVHGQGAVQRPEHDAAGPGHAHFGQRAIRQRQRRRDGAVHFHAVDADRGDGADRQRVVVSHENTSARAAGGQGAERGVQRVRGGADAGGGDEPGLAAAKVLVRVAVVGDRAGDGGHADAPSPGIQSAQRHVHCRQVANVAPAGLRHRAVGHGDRAAQGFDFDGRAAARQQVAGRGLGHITQAAQAQGTAGGLDGGVHREDAARAGRLQKDGAAAVRGDRLVHGQHASQRAQDDRAVAGGGRRAHERRRVLLKDCSAGRGDTVHRHRAHGVDRHAVAVGDEDAPAGRTRRQAGDGGLQRVRAGADADGGGQTDGAAGHVRDEIALVADAARRGPDADVARPGVEPAEEHALRRLITDVAARRHGRRAVRGQDVHRDAAGLRLDIDRAGAAGRQITGRRLRHMTAGDHAEAAGGGTHRGVHQHILVVQPGGAGLEQHIPRAAGGDGLRHRQRAVQRGQHDRAVHARRQPAQPRRGHRRIERRETRARHAPHLHAGHRADGNIILVRQEDAARARLRGHPVHGQVQRVARADGRAGDEADFRGDDIQVGVAMVKHGPAGLDRDAARARVQSAQAHVQARPVTDGAAAALRQRAVGHVDGTGRRLDVNRAAEDDHIAQRGLAHVPSRQHGDVAGGRGHRGAEDQIRARPPRGQPDVAAAVGHHGLADGKVPGQGFLHDAAVAGQGAFPGQQRIDEQHGRARGPHPVRQHRPDRAHRERVVVGQEQTAAGLRRDHGHGGVEGIARRANARARHQPQALRRHVLVQIPAIGDRAGRGRDADRAGPGIEAAHDHVLRGQVTDRPAAGLRHRPVRHRDRTARRFHVQGAAARADVPGGLLDHVAPGQHRDPAAAGLHGGAQPHIAGGAAGLEQDVAGTVRADGLAHRQ